ncbi:DNA damage-binding protein 2 [Ancistrocladus abbreviatus]
MAPQTRRRMAVPNFLIEREMDSEESSSSEDEAEEQELEAQDDEEEHEEERQEEEAVETKKREKKPITITLKKVCKVCKRSGHQAGFQGATYIDCPMKPCFLCKMPGHTTMSCPHRVATEHGVLPASTRNNRHSVDYVFKRQIRPNVPAIKPAFEIPDQVNCGVIRYHSRRVTCLEFHPTNNNILLSGDKKGQLGVWDFNKVSEKTVYGNVHTCILNNMRFSSVNNGTVYAASSDGTVSCTDIETGISESMMDLNPDGWHGPSSWRMLYGLDINSEKGLVLAGDNFGLLYMLDTRTRGQTGGSILIHKKGSKVVGLHCNPVQPELLLSCGNDHFARIWDIRKLEPGSSLCDLAHRRVVNSAYFSPQTGCKILTTAQDNRIRVWDSIFGSLESPSREIVHSHDFNRHLTAFRAEWDPKDPSESLVVIGRYISENYSGVALHPIDFIDISTGQLVAEVIDPNITTISPVNKLHPREDVLASGSSRSLFIWRPKDEPEFMQQKEERKIITCEKAEKNSRKKYESDGSDDEVFISNVKKLKGNGQKSKPELKQKGRKL